MIMFRKPLSTFGVSSTIFLYVLLAACGGGGGGDGDRVLIPPDPPPIITTIEVVLTAEDVVGGSQEPGGATGTVEFNQTDDEISAAVTLKRFHGGKREHTARSCWRYRRGAVHFDAGRLGR